ncbi:hypothetical protein D9Q98_003736 [Chlorella vulgaris]|uniref:Rieske domain-containing protein n=1 Tax=Chlorella vulgaris TaxID=3077 RepID=A0A9D4TT47_CHLVU|nr:hypothetical protein D9Q98_003736 [Chlorella vulgaris]
MIAPKPMSPLLRATSGGTLLAPLTAAPRLCTPTCRPSRHKASVVALSSNGNGNGSGSGQPVAEPPSAAQPTAAQARDAAATQDPAFNWNRQWYPLAPVAYLTRSKPAPYTVLGRRLVVWFHEASGRWLAMEDRCPHRLAPLSEGRVDAATGNLQCSYHGWQFGPDGHCTAIPQADSPQQEVAACGSQRSCVTAFPVRQEQGMLWVWMDPASAAIAQLTQLPLPPELLAGRSAGGGGPAGTLLGDWYMRDIPVSAEGLVENLVDPAHVHFAHNGVIGARERAGSIPLHLQGPVSAQGGFALGTSQQWESSQRAPAAAGNGSSSSAAGGLASSSAVPAVTHFVPPGLVWLEFPAPGGSRFSMLFYAVPVSPGHSRLVAGYSSDAVPPAVKALLQSDLLAPLLHAFQFVADIGNHVVLDGDTVHIYQQEQLVKREGRRAYFMPASADRGVVLLRRWLDDYAGGGPDYYQATGGLPAGSTSDSAGASSRPLSRREVLDRYEQHTKNCPSCRRALGVVQAVRQALQLGSTAAFAAAFTLAVVSALVPAAPLAPRLGRASAPLLLGLAGVMAGVLQQLLARLEQQFVFVDYVHSER